MSGESVRQRARDRMPKLTKLTDEQLVEELCDKLQTVGPYRGKRTEQEAEMIMLCTTLRLELERRLSESSLARKQEREAIAANMCAACSAPGVWKPAEFINDTWSHVRTGPINAEHLTMWKCDAAAIHERGREVEG
jgi:hypothetical protein